MSSFLPIALGLVLGIWFPLALVLAAHRRRDRLTLIDALLTALIGVVMAWIFIPWDVVPPLLWAVPVAITVFGAILAAQAWPGLGWLAAGRRRAGALVSGSVTLVIAAAVAWLVFA